MSNRSAPRPRCHRTAFDELECTIPFDGRLISKWKESIPSLNRSYDADSKAWRFWGGFAGVAVALLLEHFPVADVPIHARAGATTEIRSPDNEHFRALHLLPSAPPELVRAAFRCLSKRAHPDLGGDDAVMRRLIEAHDALTRRLSA